MAAYGREKQRRMLVYFIGQVRENFMYNFRNPEHLHDSGGRKISQEILAVHQRIERDRDLGTHGTGQQGYRTNASAKINV